MGHALVTDLWYRPEGIDVDAFMAQIRDELAGRRAWAPDHLAQSSPPEQLGVTEEVWLASYLPRAEMLEAINTAHIGVVAVKRDAFRDLTHTNKMYECIAMLKPVVISATAAVRAYFDEASFAFFESDDPVDLASAIRELYHQPERARAMIEHASKEYQQYAWGVQKQVYLDAVLGEVASAPVEAQPVGAS